MFKNISLLSESVFPTKLACFNLAAKFSAVYFLNLGVVLDSARSGISLLNSLTSVFRTLVVSQLPVPRILSSSSLIFVLKTVLAIKPIVYGVSYYPLLNFISLNFVYPCYNDLCKLK